MTTGTNNQTTPPPETASPAAGDESTPAEGRPASVPDGITSLFAAVAPVPQPPVLPPPMGDRAVVAASTFASTFASTSEQEGSASMPAIPEDVDLQVLPPPPEDAPGVGVYSAVDAEAASEIAQAINSGMIMRERAPLPFLPLRDRWVWSSVALAAFVSAILIAEGPAIERNTVEYVWWLIGTSLGSFPVAFGIGLGTAWLARLAKFNTVGSLRLSFAFGSIALFLGLAVVAERYVTELRTPKEVVYTPPPPRPRSIIIAQDPEAAVQTPVTQEQVINTVRSRHERQITIVANAMRALVDELNEELAERERRLGKEPIKSLLATTNFINSKNYAEGKKRIEHYRRICEEYEQRIMARYDHFPPRLRALDLPLEPRQQLLQAFEGSRAAAIGKLRETMMYDRALVDQVRELYAFVYSRVGKYTVSTQLWFRDPKDAAVYNTLIKRINDLAREQQRSTQQLHEESFAKLTELGNQVQWASID